uniref:hypothetical protein n=1 Tax=Bartonella sp. AA86SXKL TaxID=3243441 RepID=UPI0035CF268D
GNISVILEDETFSDAPFVLSLDKEDIEMDFVFELCMTPNKLIAIRTITSSKRMYRDYRMKVNNLLLTVTF